MALYTRTSASEVKMKLVSLNNALERFPEGYRVTKKTLYRWHQANSYPGVFVKVGHQLMFDVDEWDRLVAKAKQRSMADSVPAATSDN